MSYFKNERGKRIIGHSNTEQPGQNSTPVVRTYPCKHCDFETEKPLLLGTHMTTEHKDIMSAKRAAKKEEKRVKLAPAPPNVNIPYLHPPQPNTYITIAMWESSTTITFTVRGGPPLSTNGTPISK